MRTRFVSTLLVLLLAAAGASAQLGAFHLPISMRDSGTVAKGPGTLTFGIHPNATVCLDVARMCGFNRFVISDDSGCVVEVESPPDPPGFTYRFSPYRSSACNINIWKDDIHKNTGAAQNDTFKILVKTEPDLQDTH